MPFIPHTPESLIRRADSKNPATTCKGITQSGRPCRRDLAAPPQSSPGLNHNDGVIAYLSPGDSEHNGAAAYFCWQHKDQADSLVMRHHSRMINILPLRARTSIDTLVDRLGVIDSQVDRQGQKRRREKHHAKIARKDTLPKEWQDMDGPLLAIPGKRPSREENPGRHNKPRAQSNLALSLFCCVRPADPDPTPPPRVHRYSEKQGNTANLPARVHRPGSRSHDQACSGQPNSLQSLTTNFDPSSPSPAGRTLSPSKPVLSRDRSSHTQDLLSLIPKPLSPQTTSLLLAELAKPVSLHDEEGYIYIFWLTDITSNKVESQVASSLLSDTAASTTKESRQNYILEAHASQPRGKRTGCSKSTILLKIGRASNVQRRMNEWTRQCGYNLSLVRFYPYLPSISSTPNMTTPPAAQSSPQKVPHAHRVERLIHLELADAKVKRDCESCGKEHREWFEVESSREALRKVDETVKRWVSWGQRMK